MIEDLEHWFHSQTSKVVLCPFKEVSDDPDLLRDIVSDELWVSLPLLDKLELRMASRHTLHVHPLVQLLAAQRLDLEKEAQDLFYDCGRLVKGHRSCLGVLAIITKVGNDAIEGGSLESRLVD